jgi:hypothetical protein
MGRRLVRRGLFAAVVLLAAMAAVAALPALPVAAGRQAGSLWHVYVDMSCDERTCAGSELLPPWIASTKTNFYATSDGHRHFYDSATVAAIGRPGHPQRCDKTLFDRPFSGRCVIRLVGIGFIAPGGALDGAPDFWVTSETARFKDGQPVSDPFPPYPLDTYLIARAGYYNKVVLFGDHAPGVRYAMSVSRRPR